MTGVQAELPGSPPAVASDHGKATCCNPKAAPNVSAGKDAEDIDFVSTWKKPEERPLLPLSHRVTSHDGLELELSSLVGQPLAVSFAYTRCQNPNKCPAVTAAFAELRRKLEQAGLLDKVKLLLVTYDTEFDTPEVLRTYSERFRLGLDEHTMFLRPAADPEHRLYRDLKAPVSFNPTGVTMHGIYMILIDKAGRLARTYRVLIWDNDQVVNDLAELVREPSA